MRISVLIVALSFTLSAFAQDYDFGDVSKEELQEKFNPSDSSASATYLYKNRRTYFDYIKGLGFELKTEIHERIKIYNKDGFDYATKQLNLYKNGNTKESISPIKAFTYNLENGKIVEEKLSKKGMFNSETNKYFNKVKFTMPNIKPGSVIEYKYQITSPFWSNIDELVFQHDIPIKKLESNIEIPEYFNFRINTKGYLTVNPTTDSKTEYIRFVNKTRNQGSGYSASSTTTFNTSEVSYSTKISKYEIENVPALKNEPYVNSINNYRSSIKYELSYTKFPYSQIEYYTTTWEDVVETIFKSSNFGDELDRTGYYEDDIDNIVSSISDPERRMSLIFDFVKSKVKWNGYYGKYTDDGVKKSFKEGVGNVAEINLMLTSMLRYAGLKAHPVLVSTRGHGISLFPTREGYNYVVTYVKLPDGNVVLLDATNKYSVPNVLPLRALNWQGRVIAEHGSSELIDLYPSVASKNTITMMAKLDSEGGVEGMIRSVKTNHKALDFRERYVEANKEEFLEKLENKYNGLEVSDYAVKNDVDLSKPVMESYNFFKENQADIIGDKIYFSPLFFLRTAENPFKLEKREFPVDFGYPSSTTYRVIVTIPEGYKMESMPEPSAMALPDNLGEFKYNISGKGNSIQLIISTKINSSIITPLYYDALKEYFNKFIEKEAEQIVLTKA